MSSLRLDAKVKLNEINKLKAKIQAGTATENEKAMYEKMVVGQPMVQIGLGRPASPTERTEIAETRASIDALDNLKELFDNVQTKTGPITGRISPIAGLIGMTSDEQEAFMAATSAFKNAIIKEITGAQMSEVEAKRIMKQVPDITDPSTRWEAKWQQSRKNLEMLQKRRMEILEQSGLRVPGINEQIETPTSKEIPEEISQMSDEELMRIAGLISETPPTEAIPAPSKPVAPQEPAVPVNSPLEVKEAGAPIIEPEIGVKRGKVADQQLEAERITIAEISPIFEKAEKNGISRLDLYREAAKLKDLGLTKEDILTAYDKLAEGATAEEVIEYFKNK